MQQLTPPTCGDLVAFEGTPGNRALSVSKASRTSLKMNVKNFTPAFVQYAQDVAAAEMRFLATQEPKATKKGRKIQAIGSAPPKPKLNAFIWYRKMQQAECMLHNRSGKEPDETHRYYDVSSATKDFSVFIQSQYYLELPSVIEAYTKSADFTKLDEETRSAYTGRLHTETCPIKGGRARYIETLTKKKSEAEKKVAAYPDDETARSAATAAATLLKTTHTAFEDDGFVVVVSKPEVENELARGKRKDRDAPDTRAVPRPPSKGLTPGAHDKADDKADDDESENDDEL